jgi:hypothetical protein
MISHNYKARCRMVRIKKKGRKMSDLTQCNFCSLVELRARAMHEKKAVTLITGRPSHGLPNGIDVYVHPRGVNVRMLSEGARHKYWNRWFMELSDRCVC